MNKSQADPLNGTFAQRDEPSPRVPVVDATNDFLRFLV